MMKIYLFFFIFYFLFFKFNKFLIQMIYQNLMMLMFLYLLMIYPLNNLNNWMLMYYIYSVDFYSLGLILLTMWILMLMILVSWKIINMNKIFYMNLINSMLLVLMMCFSTFNLILFYIYFEIGLIPVFMLIMGWGVQIDRIQAGLYMILYTLLGSLPLFMIIIYLYLLNYSLMMDLLNVNNFNMIIYFMLILAFLIKMPMYFVHLWLPKAHVEAPVTGSMILAGVMLKLGSYGLMRVMLMMLNMCIKLNKFIIIISLMGGVVSSLICLCQIDMKMLVAYSSVVHMSLLMSGLMTLFNWGYYGAYLMMIAHGLCSSGMFCLVNMSYERVMSRSLYINKGLINYMPSLSLMWFFLCSSNMSFPPSLNLFSEIMLLNSLIIWSKFLMMMLMLLLFFSACYSLYLYSFSQHGKMNLLNYFFSTVKIFEYLVLLLHWIPLNMMFLFMYIYS